MKYLHTLVTVALLAVPVSASAATVSLSGPGGNFSATLVATGSAAWSAVDQSNSTMLPSGASWSVSPQTLPNETYGIAPPKVSDPCSNACSPFYGGVIGAPTTAGAAGWETTPFFTVFDTPSDQGSVVREAFLNFSAPQSALSLLWGSPDEKNVIDLILGGSIVASFWGSDFNWFWGTNPNIVGQPGSGAALLTLSGLAFDSVRFATWSSKGSFEFSNVTASPAPVPVPPAALALLAGLGMLAAAGRRRRACA